MTESRCNEKIIRNASVSILSTLVARLCYVQMRQWVKGFDRYRHTLIDYLPSKASRLSKKSRILQNVLYVVLS